MLGPLGAKCRRAGASDAGLVPGADGLGDEGSLVEEFVEGGLGDEESLVEEFVDGGLGDGEDNGGPAAWAAPVAGCAWSTICLRISLLLF